MKSPRAKVFAPATIGNVGPGFDVLGIAVDGLGDWITVELVDTDSRIDSVTGRDAEVIPREASQNCAAIAALTMLRQLGDAHEVAVSIERALPASGGLGASAASSVGGALAAAIASGRTYTRDDVLTAALAGEAAVAGRHLDNIAPCVDGGLSIVRSCDPVDVIAVPISGEWWLTTVSPAIKLATKDARAVLPADAPRSEFITQMANTAALVRAFATGDHAIASRALVDVFAEPRRATLIPQFHAVKRAALAAKALGCSISGAGPTVFALCRDRLTAERSGEAMMRAFSPLAATVHVGRVATQGAHVV